MSMFNEQAYKAIPLVDDRQEHVGEVRIDVAVK